MDQFAFNGTIYSYLSCFIRLNGVALEGVRGLDFDDTRPRTLVQGSRRSGAPLGMTAGSYTPGTATFTVLRATADLITTTLVPQGLGSYGDAGFVLMVQVLEPDSTALPQTTVLSGCKITGVKDGHQVGDEALTTEFTIQPLQILRNGKPLFSVVRSITA